MKMKKRSRFQKKRSPMNRRRNKRRLLLWQASVHPLQRLHIRQGRMCNNNRPRHSYMISPRNDKWMPRRKKKKKSKRITRRKMSKRTTKMTRRRTLTLVKKTKRWYRKRLRTKVTKR